MIETGLWVAAFICWGLAVLDVAPGRLVPAGLALWALTHLVGRL